MEFFKIFGTATGIQKYLVEFGLIIALVALVFGYGYHKGSASVKEQQSKVELSATKETLKDQVALDGKLAGIHQQSGESKNAINKVRDNLNSSIIFNGVPDTSTSSDFSTGSTFGIKQNRSRFSEQDGKFLNNFAAECQVIAVERNEAIISYEELAKTINEQGNK